MTVFTLQVNKLLRGVQSGMAAGEFPITLITPNLRLKVTSTLVVGINNSVLPVPTTPIQIEQGFLSSKVTLGPTGLTACPNIGSYTQLSVLQWSVNPYANSRAIKSELLRFSTTSQASGNAVRRRLSLQGNTYKLKGVPAYTLTIQYSTPQNFDFTAGLDYSRTEKSKSNYTIPECTRFDGKRYVSCNGCDITSYTNYNVTYSCYDISQICPSSVVRRSLLESSSVEENEVEVEEEEEEVEKIYEEHTDSYKQLDSSDSEDETRLLAEPDDDTNTRVVPSTYGMLVRSIVAEISAVLTNNPFTLNLGQSKTVLIFVGCLSGFIFLMLLYLLRRDNKERILKTYVKTTNVTKARMLLEEDIKNGRKGDHSMLYQSHITDIKRDCNRSAGIMRCLERNARGGYGLGIIKKIPRKVTVPPVYPSYLKSLDSDSEYGDDSGSDTGTEEDSLGKRSNSHGTEAAITEFLHRLFPGHGIFKKKTNAIMILASNHDYFKMFGGSTKTRSRTIRFLELVALVLINLFVDTVFFGVAYPANTCNSNTDEVGILNKSQLTNSLSHQLDFSPSVLFCETLYCTVLSCPVLSFLSSASILINSSLVFLFPFSSVFILCLSLPSIAATSYLNNVTIPVEKDAN